MLPDIPGKKGQKSTVQYYIDRLEKLGISVSASHYHWTGVGDPFMLAIHSYSQKLSPLDFTQRTLKALNETLRLIKQRMKNNNLKH